MPHGEPHGRLGSTVPGLTNPGWQFPLADPGAATRNKLREMGAFGNPFNRQHMAAIDELAASAYAQFLVEAAQGGIGGENIASEFGNFLGQLISGERPKMGYNQALGGMESLRSNLGGVAQKVGAAGIDPMDPTALGEFASKGGVNPIEYAIAGLLADPKRQAQVFQGAMLPSMGPGMVKGMATSMAPMEQMHSDLMERVLGGSQEGQFSSLLDLLLGKLTGAPQGRGMMPARTGGMGGPQQFPGF